MLVKYLMAIIVFLLMFVSGLVVYKDEISIPKRMKNSLRYYLEIIVVAVIFSLIISYINPKNPNNILVYFLLVILLPYVRLSKRKAENDEELFNDVVLYCSSMALLMKQNISIYMALEKCALEVSDPLKSDIRELMDGLVESKQQALYLTEKMNTKYPYTIIKQLNILIIQLYYESNVKDNRLIEIFEDDIALLNEDVKENQLKRKVIRVEYIGLCVGCILSMWLLVGQLKNALNLYKNDYIGNVILIYYLAVIVILVICDIYFNSHISRE